MKTSKILLTVLLGIVFLQGCSDDDDAPTIVVNEPDPVVVTSNTIVDVARANGSFTTLVAALEATGLDATLSDANGEFTVFAPSDDAFALLGQDTISGLLADTDTLSNVLTYHVVAGRVDAAAAIAAAGTTVDTANGGKVGFVFEW